jgi:hypothetical protein
VYVANRIKLNKEINFIFKNERKNKVFDIGLTHKTLLILKNVTQRKNLNEVTNISQLAFVKLGY